MPHHPKLLALAMVIGAGCSRVTYVTGRAPNGVEHSGWSHFFLWGLVNTSEIDVTELCPHGLSKLVVRSTFGSWLAGFVTLGVYSPRTHVVYCAGPA